MRPKPLIFPKDELAHSAVIEWWYFNGNLQDQSGSEYAFMHCLFKVNPQKVNLPFLNKITVPDLYFSHYVVSDVKNQKFSSGVRLFYEGIGKESFSKKLLLIKSPENFLIAESKPFSYKLKTAEMDLDLISQKPVLLVNESGWVDVKNGGTYYYSLTNLKAKGKLTFENKEIPVSGKCWLDHQWSDEPASSEDKWVWFSLQLENQTEILCCEYGDRKKIRFASISYPDGRQATTYKIELKPTGKAWTSPKTKAIYPVNWQIELPEWNIKINAAPKIINQEVIFGSINYWEGGISVKADCQGEKILGNGFMEIVGVPMGKSITEFYLKEAEKFISDYLHRYI